MKYVTAIKSLLIAASCIGATAILPLQAQGTQGQPPVNLIAYQLCSTQDYRDVTAKALGITTVELRKQLAAGKTLQDIAAAHNVALDNVTKAVADARKAALDQAVKDGLLTQDEANQMQSFAGQGNPPASGGPAMMGTMPAGGPGNPPGGNGAGPAMMGTMPAGGPGNPPGASQGGSGGQLNAIQPYVVAAKALNLSCTDLVKTLVSDQSKTIVAVAADQKLDVKVVTDALLTAYKSAQDQDVKDGILTADQGSAANADIATSIDNFVKVQGLMMGMPNGPMPATPAR